MIYNTIPNDGIIYNLHKSIQCNQLLKFKEATSNKIINVSIKFVRC